MKTLYLWTGLLFFSVYAAVGQPLFQEHDFHALHIIREIHSTFNKDGITGGHPLFEGESVAWSSFFIDTRKPQLSDRWVFGSEPPDHFQDPDAVRLYTGNISYDISHTRKQATLDEIGFDQLSMRFHLDGWYLLGVNLSQLIENTAEEAMEAQADGSRRFRIKPPRFPYPTEIFINEEKQVTQVIMIEHERIDGEEPGWKTVTRFKWATEPESGFAYPAYQESTTTGNNSSFNTEIRVREIEINPVLPPGIFEPDYTEDYRVIDRRKLIKPFRF